MTKRQLRCFAAMAAIVGLSGAASAQIVYSEDFEAGFTPPNFLAGNNGWTGFDSSGDGTPNSATFASWLVTAKADIGLTDGINATVGLLILWDDNEDMDDWAISPGISLTAGTPYRLQFRLDTDGTFSPDVRAYFTTDASSAANALAASTTVYSADDVSSANVIVTATDFTPPSSGTYFVAFRDVSTPPDSSYYTIIDDITVTDTLLSVSDWELMS